MRFSRIPFTAAAMRRWQSSVLETGRRRAPAGFGLQAASGQHGSQHQSVTDAARGSGFGQEIFYRQADEERRKNGEECPGFLAVRFAD